MASGNSNNLNNKDNIKLKFTGENAELELNDFKIDDISLDINENPKDLKLDVETGGSNEPISNGLADNNEEIETMVLDDGTNNDKSTDMQSNADTASSTPSSDTDTEISNENANSDVSGATYDDRTLREKAKDLKDDINRAKENIKNLPQGLKDKKEELKQKADKAKEKAKKAKENIKNLPENAKKKAEDIKKRASNARDNIKNFPKNRKQIASNLKNSAKDAAKRVGNVAKNTAKNAANAGKERLKDEIENSKPVQAAKKAKNVYDKGKKAIYATKKAGKATVKAVKAAASAIKGIIDAFVATFPVSAIVLGIVLLVALIIIVAVIVFPGKIDVNDLYASDNYSEKDNSTLAKLRNIYQKYPNGDAALAMLAVVYPHYQTLQGNEVTYYLESGEKELDPSKVYEDTDEEESKTDDDGDDKSTCEDEECKSTASDDMYLELFRKWTYRYKFKKLMKKSNSMSEDDFIKYLRDDYIQSESAYKKLIDIVDDDKKEEFLDAVIEDLKSKKNYFTSYIYENVSCTSNEQSLGTYNSDIIKGQPVIVLKDSQSGVFSEIKAASSLYETDDLSLSLKRYAMGVAYSEVGIYVKNEAMAKAEMIAAKSFVLGRTAPGSANTMGMGFGYDQVDDKTVFYLRGNTYDQDFCDVYEGCITGRYAKSNVTAGNSEARINQKEPLDSQSIENLSKWYDETMSEFIFDDKTKTFNGTQFSSYGYDLCKVGTCMSQTDAIKAAESGSTYDEILYKLAYSSFTKYDMETSNIVTVSTNCTDAKLSCGISNDDFKYYSQINEPYGSSTFCHRTDGGTIKHAGCGITSMAMVIANLADPNVTPFTTNEEAFNGGYCGNGTGTSYTYFFEAANKYNIKYTYGLKSNSTDITKASGDIVNTIKKGGLAIINVNGSWLNGNSGHYIVAKGVDENNNLVIADPYAESLDKPVRNNVSAQKILTDFVNNDSGWFMFTSDKSNEIVNKYCKQSGESDKNWFKAANYNIDNVKSIGKQCEATCFSTVMAYGTLMNKNKVIDIDGSYIQKCRTWGKGATAYYGTSHYYNNESEMISAIVKEIDKGNTVAVHGKSSINQHWVLAVGYNKKFVGSDTANIKASDILIVDPYTASESTLSKSLSGGVFIQGYNNLIIWN